MKTKKKSNILLTEGGVSGLGSCRVSGLVQSQKCVAPHFCELSIWTASIVRMWLALNSRLRSSLCSPDIVRLNYAPTEL